MTPWKEIFSFTWKEIMIGSLIGIGVVSFIIAVSCVAYGAETGIITCEVKSDLNVRDAPSFKGPVIGRLTLGTTIGILDASHKRKPWVFISFPEGTIGTYLPMGWVHARYLINCKKEEKGG